MLRKLFRLYHTVKPLRFEQIGYRLYYKLLPLRKLPDFSGQYAANTWVWNGPEFVEPSYLGNSTYCFLNCEGVIQNRGDWNNPKFEKLWLYNLHYFDDLNAQDNLQRKDQLLEQVMRWTRDNPPVSGNGWEPYPLSLRIVNLVKWYRRASIADQTIVNSIAQQSDALSRQLEYHILGNHLFANAKALIFSGCFLNGPKACLYLDLGIKILDKELPEQFLEDGGHFELSPMYHCILLWDLLELIHLASISGNNKLVERIQRWSGIAKKGLFWLKNMVHPDGDISFFNDSAFGIAPSPSEIFSFAHKVGIEPVLNEKFRLITLPVSGYSKVVMPKHSLIFDHAAIGSDYLPGHGHADALSFEWSVGSQRVFVNSGTSVYGIGEERLRQRQTAAHNTVEVNHTDSSEVWSGFRVARRANTKLEVSEEFDDSVVLVASHDGYKRLSKSIVHRREVWVKEQVITIKDDLIGSKIPATAHFHVHPDIKAIQINDQNVELVLPNGTNLVFCTSGLCQIQKTTWHPYFGESILSNKIIVQLNGPELMTSITIPKV